MQLFNLECFHIFVKNKQTNKEPPNRNPSRPPRVAPRRSPGHAQPSRPRTRARRWRPRRAGCRVLSSSKDQRGRETFRPLGVTFSLAALTPAPGHEDQGMPSRPSLPSPTPRRFPFEKLRSLSLRPTGHTEDFTQTMVKAALENQS